MGQILKISGPLVVAEGMSDANMFDVVQVGPQKLIGEIIEMHGDKASIQVYEETAGLKRGDEVLSTGAPLSVELAPGMMEGIYDGIQRPLEEIRNKYGDLIDRGLSVHSISRERLWAFTPVAEKGAQVQPGDILGTVEETPVVLHKIMVPHGVSGEVVSVAQGDFTIEQPVATIRTDKGEVEVTMLQRWPVRKGRPFKQKLMPQEPLVTGQRIIDTLFPLAKGGTAAVPGPFGSGKTVVQHCLAKYSNVDIVIYIGCGERGNEMTDVLREFPELKDPRTGETLMKRTVLIANTSDMPVAAREASIYTGITIAEYFRDMGYDVAVIADSTSRWAEALREMSGRLEEMPGEEGYPAYLSSRLAQFYERAGRVEALCSEEGRTGSISAIGAVSPPGGDLSEPVSQATMRIVKVFWALDASLAYRRHFPAINWLNSYSLYEDKLSAWYDKNINKSFSAQRVWAMGVLQNEASLQEIVRLVGVDALGPNDRLILEVARMIREDFLQQNAFSDIDAFSSAERQFKLLQLMDQFNSLAKAAMSEGVGIERLLAMPVLEDIGRAKSVPADKMSEAYAKLEAALKADVAQTIKEVTGA